MTETSYSEIVRLDYVLFKIMYDYLKGFGEFSLWANKSKKEVYTCLEATGIYSFDLAQYLSQQKVNVMVGFL
jgi:hypothetical protein